MDYRAFAYIRRWTGEDNSEPYGYFCYEKDDSIIQMVAYPVDPATVGQYVGMPDKNRTKIFDGDLLKYTRGEDDAPYRVFWDNFSWYIQCENRMPDRLSGSQPEDWEIIGNIYDNPELLEATK